MNNSAIIIRTAIASLLAAGLSGGSSGNALAAKEQGEKCAGVVKVGKNDLRHVLALLRCAVENRWREGRVDLSAQRYLRKDRRGRFDHQKMTAALASVTAPEHLHASTHPGFAGSARRAPCTQSEQHRLIDLIERCALRDQRAFAELYVRTGAKMYAAAVRIVGRRDWAQDVVQESYLNIWTHVEDYRASLGAPLTWMIAIVRNRALDWVRHPDLECHAENYDDLAEALPDTAPGPDYLLAAKRSACTLTRCLHQLSSNERQAIVLAYSRGLSHSELARHLDEPIGSVKTRIRRGLFKLRQCIDNAEA